MRVLLAEDDKRLGKLIQYMLEQNDIQVEWVTNGSDIYEYAMYTDYDILILDWMMPGETGVEACSRLRKDGYEKAILMLTARDSVEDRVTGLDAGADDYLVKPFEFAELMAPARARPPQHAEDPAGYRRGRRVHAEPHGEGPQEEGQGHPALAARVPDL